MNIKRFIKIVLITLSSCFITIIILFFLAWSGIFGNRYHNISNDVLGRFMNATRSADGAIKLDFINHETDCIGNCFVGDGIVEKFGMLSIRQPKSACAEDCGDNTKYRFEELNLNKNGEYANLSIFLKSPNFPDAYDELMVKLYGKIEKDGLKGLFGGPKDLMTVKGYKILSKVQYHNFLRDEKGRYTKEKYGCKIQWNATFGWEYSNNQPIIKVRMTSNSKGENPGKFIELWYDGNTASFIKEVNNLGLLSNPCDIPN